MGQYILNNSRNIFSHIQGTLLNWHWWGIDPIGAWVNSNVHVCKSNGDRKQIAAFICSWSYNSDCNAVFAVESASIICTLWIYCILATFTKFYIRSIFLLNILWWSTFQNYQQIYLRSKKRGFSYLSFKKGYYSLGQYF